ncbi:MAG: hypothetical protein HOP09_15345 [Hyphomicrobium sp.]|nr:hypothetical protein [Hyphomicrobium sp.]
MTLSNLQENRRRARKALVSKYYFEAANLAASNVAFQKFLMAVDFQGSELDTDIEIFRRAITQCGCRSLEDHCREKLDKAFLLSAAQTLASLEYDFTVSLINTVGVVSYTLVHLQLGGKHLLADFCNAFTTAAVGTSWKSSESRLLQNNQLYVETSRIHSVLVQ